MNATGAFWYVVAAVAAALIIGFLAFVRKSFRWMLGRVKVAYLEWFSEAVEEHVGPRLEQLRDDTQGMADALQASATAAAEAQEAKLEQHTTDEGEVVRMVVREELGPLVDRIENLESKL